MATEEKRQEVKKLTDKFERAQALVLSDYRGLNANDMNEMREYFSKRDIEYRVVKNTLAAIAAVNAELDGLPELMEGPTGIALGYDDPVLPFQIAKKCQEDFAEYSTKGGVLEQELVPPSELEEIAALSSKDELYGKVAVALQAPVRKIAVALKDKLNQLVRVLDQVREGQEDGAEEE
ncbi:MAG: 50S ribosomal protein L10 [Candidatus Bipolaricaulota bacterium]